MNDTKKNHLKSYLTQKMDIAKPIEEVQAIQEEQPSHSSDNPEDEDCMQEKVAQEMELDMSGQIFKVKRKKIDKKAIPVNCKDSEDIIDSLQ